jgi:hypothetical protein
MDNNGFPVTQAAPLIGMCFVLFIYLMIAVLFVVVYCKIYSKAGYPWAMGLLMLIPIVNIVMMLILAFSEWPIQRQLRQLQQMAGQSSQGENFRNL